MNSKALIDTGATGSCISKRFADATKLVYFTMAEVNTAQGIFFAPVYLIDISQ
jgi:predicted aspartyl protease